MAKSRTETQPLTPAQSEIVFDAELNPDDFLKAGASQSVNLNPGDILRNPREWAKLANVLAMKDKPPGLQLDFEKLAVYYNNAFKKASSGNPHPPKLLTAGECRKIIIALTRDQFRDAAVNYKKNAADETAKLAKAEALGILRKYGWTAKASKRRKKTKKIRKPDENSGSTVPSSGRTGDPKITPPVSQEPLEQVNRKPTSIEPVQTVGVTGATSKPTSSQIVDGVTGNKEVSDATKAAESNIRFYVKGNSDELSEQLLNIGGKRDDVKGEWYFPTAVQQTTARELRNVAIAKKSTAVKSAK